MIQSAASTSVTLFALLVLVGMAFVFGIGTVLVPMVVVILIAALMIATESRRNLPARSGPHDTVVSAASERSSDSVALTGDAVFVVQPTSSTTVEAWSRTRLPFDVRGEMHAFRQELRESLAQLAAAEGQQLRAVYTSPVREAVDLENVLLYNVGAAAFAATATSALLVERHYADIPPPPVLVAGAQHHHRYEIVPAPASAAHWAPTRQLASVGPTALPTLGERIDPIWFALRQGPGAAEAPATPGVPLGLGLTASPPAGRGANLAGIVKVVVDAVVACFSRFPTTATDGSVRLLAALSRKAAKSSAGQHDPWCDLRPAGRCRWGSAWTNEEVRLTP